VGKDSTSQNNFLYFFTWHIYFLNNKKKEIRKLIELSAAATAAA
jgi:hypothetical protein